MLHKNNAYSMSKVPGLYQCNTDILLTASIFHTVIFLDAWLLVLTFTCFKYLLSFNKSFLFSALSS